MIRENADCLKGEKVMRQWKMRILSLLVAAVMVLDLFTIPVMASELETVPEQETVSEEEVSAIDGAAEDDLEDEKTAPEEGMETPPVSEEPEDAAAEEAPESSILENDMESEEPADTLEQESPKQEETASDPTVETEPEYSGAVPDAEEAEPDTEPQEDVPESEIEKVSGDAAPEEPQTEEILEESEEEPVLAQASSGSCGTNLKWSFSGGKLTITGSGAMTNYSSSAPAPWNSLKADITSIVVGDGVTVVGRHAFSGLVNVQSISMPYSLTSIEDNAFEWVGETAGIEKIDFTGTVRSFGSEVFAHSGVKKLNVPYADSWGINAFQYCTQLERVTFDDNITSIPKNMFGGCTNLTDVDLPDKLTSIGESAFWNTGLSTVSIPSGVTTISTAAFSGCQNLYRVEIPEGVTAIKNSAFYNCKALQSVVIPASVQEIGSQAFWECTALKMIRFMGSLPQISKDSNANGSFSGVTATVYYPANASGWTEGALDGSSGGGKLTLVPWGFQYTLENGVLTVSGDRMVLDERLGAFPWEDRKNEVVELRVKDGILAVDAGFDQYENLQSVTLAGSVKFIGMASFMQCDKLKTVKLSNGLESIEDFAFMECVSLKEIIIPDSVTNIGECAFNDCSSLENAVMPASVANIGEGVFGLCSSLRTAQLPENLTNIPAHTFGGCTNLSSIAIPAGVTGIGQAAFSDCNSLSSITIPDGVERIDCAAFYQSGLTEIILPEKLTVIGAQAFENCESLKEIRFSGSVPTIAVHPDYPSNTTVFDGVTAVVYYPLGNSPDGLKDYGGNLTLIPYGEIGGSCGEGLTWTLDSAGTLVISGTGNMDDYNYMYIASDNTDGTAAWAGYAKPAPWFSYADAVRSVRIESGVKSIGKYAFYECASLREITISDSVTSIGESAFSGCTSLEKITIPEGVTSLTRTFSGCTSLRTVTIPGTLTVLGPGSFSGCTSLKEIYFKGDLPAIENEYTVDEVTNSDPVFTNVTAVVYYPEGNTTWNSEALNNCGGTISVKGHAHTWTSEILVKPTCVAEGKERQTCSVCLEEKENVIPATGKHTPASAWTVTKEATCTAAGTKVQKCTVCQTAVNTQSIPAKGHAFSDWQTTAKATVFAAESQKRTCTVCGTSETRTVGSVLKPAMKVTASSIKLKKGQSTTKLKVSGLAAGDSVKSWKSSNTKYVTVSKSGKITGKKVGSAKVTVTLASGMKKTVKVTVQKNAVKTTKISGISKSLSLKKGKSVTLKPVLSPITSVEKITYTTSDKKVVTVNSKGKITAKKKGTATITVKAGSKTVKCKVKVK